MSTAGFEKYEYPYMIHLELIIETSGTSTRTTELHLWESLTIHCYVFVVDNELTITSRNNLKDFIFLS